MSETISVEAIILKRWDYGEKDQIISFFSREKGRMQGIAKGAKVSRRRFGGAIDLFGHSKIQLRENKGKALSFIEQAQVLSSFSKIQKSYNSILLASGLLEIAYRFYHEGEGAYDGFDVLLKALHQLEETGQQREIFWQYLLQQLRITGFAPQFHRCVQCNNESHASFEGFDLHRGGMICNPCSASAIRILEVPSTLKQWIENFSTIAPSPRPSPSRERVPDRVGEGALCALLNLHEEERLSKILAAHIQNHMHLDLDWERFLAFL